MEAFMRILVSVMALAVALAWPSLGEAQSKKKSGARKAATVVQKHTPRPRPVVRRSVEQRPCAGYLWWGCVGWDPDPQIRNQLVRDMADDP
jgi:hypothetical protein